MGSLSPRTIEEMRSQLAERVKARMGIYTTGDASQLWGVTAQTVLNWIHNGYVNAIQIDGRGWHFITQEEILRVEENCFTHFHQDTSLTVRSYMRVARSIKRD